MPNPDDLELWIRSVEPLDDVVYRDVRRSAREHLRFLDGNRLQNQLHDRGRLARAWRTVD